jgi:hypothetical protein
MNDPRYPTGNDPRIREGGEPMPWIRVRVAADDGDLEGFHHAVTTSVARHEGWVEPEGPDRYQVVTAQVDPFRAWAETFGLRADPEGPTALVPEQSG